MDFLIPFKVEGWVIPLERCRAALEALREVDLSDIEHGISYERAVELHRGSNFDEVNLHLLRFGWLDDGSAYGPRASARSFEVGGIYYDFANVEESRRMFTALIPFVSNPKLAKTVMGRAGRYPMRPEFGWKIENDELVEVQVTAEVEYY